MEADTSVTENDLVERTRALAREVLAPLAAEGPARRVNRPLVRALGAHGLLRRLFDPEDGYAGVSALELCLVREALASESVAAETAFALQGLGAYPIAQAGSAETIKRWLPAVARGDAIAAFALTEPAAGSDAGAIELRAERVTDGYRLTGTKTYISNAPEADVYTVFARTTPGARARGVTAFAVAGASTGLSGTPLALLAEHPVGTLEFDGVPVHDSQVLGDVDGGFRVAMQTLDLFRPSVGACAVGMAQAALEAATSHAAVRRAFDRPLREFQAVSHRLAEMATRTHAARLLVRDAAEAYDRSAPDVTKKAAMAKLFATETAQEVVDGAIQIHGAVACRQDHLLAHLYQEVRTTRIYEGASEIQREIVARELYR